MTPDLTDPDLYDLSSQRSLPRISPAGRPEARTSATNPDDQYRNGVFEFIRDNGIAVVYGFGFGMLATVGLAWVWSLFL